MSAEPIFRAVEDDFVGNNIEVVVRDGVFYFEIENPWQGSTETGFGANTYYRMTTEDAKRLIAFLQQ